MPVSVDSYCCSRPARPRLSMLTLPSTPRASSPDGLNRFDSSSRSTPASFRSVTFCAVASSTCRDKYTKCLSVIVSCRSNVFWSMPSTGASAAASACGLVTNRGSAQTVCCGTDIARSLPSRSNSEPRSAGSVTGFTRCDSPNCTYRWPSSNCSCASRPMTRTNNSTTTTSTAMMRRRGVPRTGGRGPRGGGRRGPLVDGRRLPAVADRLGAVVILRRGGVSTPVMS